MKRPRYPLGFHQLPPRCRAELCLQRRRMYAREWRRKGPGLVDLHKAILFAGRHQLKRRLHPIRGSAEAAARQQRFETI